MFNMVYGYHGVCTVFAGAYNTVIQLTRLVAGIHNTILCTSPSHLPSMTYRYWVYCYYYRPTSMQYAECLDLVPLHVCLIVDKHDIIPDYAVFIP